MFIDVHALIVITILGVAVLIFSYNAGYERGVTAELRRRIREKKEIEKRLPKATLVKK